MKEEFDFSKDYVLANDCVMLRPLLQNDADLLVHFALNEPQLWQYSLISAAGKSKMDNYIQSAIESRDQKNGYAFIVFDKRTNEYAGSTRFYDIQIKHQTLQLGYTWYGQQFQGSGLNANCKFLMLCFAFDRMGFERVEFRADVNNARSIAAMKSIGCTVEGVLKSNLMKEDGARRDSIVLRILKEEWNAGVKELLEKKFWAH
ncbi:MAG: GNAT family protein [Sphingobacteriia bacterium]|jgi:RimJ/RimL family protein N-acetyltransferase